MGDPDLEADRIVLGTVSRPHGVRGEVLVRSYCEPPEEIAALGPLTNRDGTTSFSLTLRGATSKGLIAQIDGVADRDAAEALRGTDLYVERARLPEPLEDEVYQVDVVGLNVANSDGKKLGTVVAVQNFGAGDLIEVRLPDRDRTEFYPFEPKFIAGIDFDRGEIVLAIDDSDDPDYHSSPPNSEPT